MPDTAAAAEANVATADPREAAKRAFDRGLSAVASGRFEAAVENFEEAYRLRPHPVTLFNLALALEKAQRLPEAWGLFDMVVELVPSDAERREVRRHMQIIAGEIAIIELDARPHQRLCIDGVAPPRTETGTYRLPVEAGSHTLVLDDRVLVVEFAPGDRRVLLLDDRREGPPPRGQDPVLTSMIGLSIGSGVGALALGLGAALASPDATRTGLAIGAAGSASVAVLAGIVALAVERRANVRANQVATTLACPGGGPLESRLDLELGPTVAQPVTITSPPPTPTTSSVVIPRDPTTPPHGVPRVFPLPRSVAAQRATDQNRPTTTTPM